MRLTMLFCFTPSSRTLYFLLLYSTSTIRYCKTSYLGCFAIAETFSILKFIALSNVSQLRQLWLCVLRKVTFITFMCSFFLCFVTIFHVGTKKTAALVLDSVITVCVCVRVCVHRIRIMAFSRWLSWTCGSLPGELTRVCPSPRYRSTQLTSCGAAAFFFTSICCVSSARSQLSR